MQHENSRLPWQMQCSKSDMHSGRSSCARGRHRGGNGHCRRMVLWVALFNFKSPFPPQRYEASAKSSKWKKGRRTLEAFHYFYDLIEEQGRFILLEGVTFLSAT
mmetsp:Transcript_34332/g.58139  ORF Transcript_34332/g.58139 Transcript_34332/m.58139 type:complete len:104 (-) Transcript_34332:92-403(-)